MPHPNSVLILRATELAKSTRSFNARGTKVVRCEHCLVPKSECICQHRPHISSHSAMCFIMYQGECFKPSNTGRIIADVVKDNHAFLWQRTEFDPQLLALLNDPQYAPIVVFPQQYAEESRCITTQTALNTLTQGKKPLFVMLDGTWREAKKMFKSAYLAQFPVLGIQPISGSNYQLREAAHLHQLCTAEVAIEILKMVDDNIAATALEEYFSLFRQAYIVHKPHLKLIK
ncbi:tRNA-uridine aminocarboxypropyltransferase [Paraglaciecola hydrolytica]|uniref:tRNA-uridine aminocarboxypropyltransferase n=1 Tax=Paraglaciecola hydrolytica TaxID=1799789 RepID=A0A136A0G6_9ALTE|nr:DTW domain-containing protein [Paraglaciecola hydrolytica]KXI28748.1 hypothetical protein AX660_11055 [Paraglaciecola hydrolytica]